MAKRYIAIGIDGDGDVVASSVGCDVEASAITAIVEGFEKVTIHHVIEITVPNKVAPKVKTTKLTIG